IRSSPERSLPPPVSSVSLSVLHRPCSPCAGIQSREALRSQRQQRRGSFDWNKVDAVSPIPIILLDLRRYHLPPVFQAPYHNGHRRLKPPRRFLFFQRLD